MLSWISVASNWSSTAQRRGAIEHYYRAIVRPFFSDRDWKRLPQSGRAAISDVTLQIIWEDVSEAIESGTFEARPDRHLSHRRWSSTRRAGGS